MDLTIVAQNLLRYLSTGQTGGGFSFHFTAAAGRQESWTCETRDDSYLLK